MVIAWPAMLAALALISLPFIGFYLLLRRLSGSEQNGDVAETNGVSDDDGADANEEPDHEDDREDPDDDSEDDKEDEGGSEEEEAEPEAAANEGTAASRRRHFLGPHRREEHDLPQALRARQDHHQAVDAEADAARRGHPLLQRLDEDLVVGLGLLVAPGLSPRPAPRSGGAARRDR